MFFSQDLVRLGERGRVGGGCGPCPYFLSLDMYKKADIVFMPYNYVIDPGMRDVLGDRLKDAVVLLDEAHNIGESIFGYFWLFLVIFGYFLVIFGNLRTGNWTDGVFCSQEPRLVLRVLSVSLSTRAGPACAMRAPRGRIRPSRVPRDASSANPGPSRGSARRNVSRVPPGLSRVKPARRRVRCVSPFYLRMGNWIDN